MAYNTFTDLSAAIADWLNRTDLTSVIPDFISLAEDRLGEDLQLSEWETTTTDTTVSGTSTIARPAGSLGIRSIKLNTDPITSLDYLSPEQMDLRYVGSENGQPKAFTIAGNLIRLAPTPDAAYTVEYTYYAKPTALSVSNETNWYTDNAPNLLLYASLLEAEPYLEADQRIPIWLTAYKQQLDAVKKRDNRIKYPTGMTLQIRAG